MKIYYRLEGDRKFFSSDFSAVAEYAKNKKGLSDQQYRELVKFGTTQDGNCGIKQFAVRQ